MRMKTYEPNYEDVSTFFDDTKKQSITDLNGIFSLARMEFRTLSYEKLSMYFSQWKKERHITDESKPHSTSRANELYCTDCERFRQ